MNAEYLLLQLKRSRIDYAILIVAFLLIASNQVFETTPLRASGTIEITDGPAIPQENNYSITTEIVPSVTSAMVMNHTMGDEYGLYFDLPIDGVSKLVFNITLQSTLDNTFVGIAIDLGYYHTTFDVIVGTLPTVFSLEPDMALVPYDSDHWMVHCGVRITTDTAMELENIVLWAEFDTPVSPVVLNWQSTDGEGLFDNVLTRRMRHYYRPEIVIERQSGNRSGYLNARFQNRTIYLKPQNYSISSSWGGEIHSISEFNFSVFENVSTLCTFCMKTIKISLSFDSEIPMLRLTVSRGRNIYRDIYDLYFQNSELPEYLFIPPFYDGFVMEIISISPLHETNRNPGDIRIEEYTSANGTYHQNVEVKMPYLHLLGFLVTPHDLLQISLAIVLFSLILIRLVLFFNSKKPRTSWKDPRLIPIILIGLTAFLPWFSSIREIVSYFDTTIHVMSFGIFPLILCWTETGGIFLAIPPNGINWAILSLIFFWVPLLYANYAMTPPSDFDDNLLASLLLFSPLLLLLGPVQLGLSGLYSFPFTLSIIIQSILILVPTVFLSFIILLKITGKYEFGRHKNQLSLDVKLAEQLTEKKAQSVIQESPRAIVDRERTQLPFEKELYKTINLVLVISLFLFFLIPSSIGFYYRGTLEGFVLDNVFYGNPVNSVGIFLIAIMGNPGSSVLWVFIIPVYFIFTMGFIGEFAVWSRKGLSLIFCLIWASVPLFILTSFSISHFYYYGVEWILLSLPYFVLTCVTVMKVGMYVKDEISIRSMLTWILLPVIFIIPGGLLLNWISTIQFLTPYRSVYVWVPLPIATIILTFIIWPLKRWVQGVKQNNEIEYEMDDILHSTDTTVDIG